MHDDSSLHDLYKNVKLHMLGKIQSNKAKKAVKLFDYIHSLDNAKLATKVKNTKINHNLLCINIENENVLEVVLFLKNNNETKFRQDPIAL